MKRLLLILAVLLALAAAVAFAQPYPGDTTGIVTGTPTGVGQMLLMIVQLAAGALSTFLLTKVATKLTFIQGWVTVFSGTVIGGVMGWLFNLLLGKVNLATGLTFMPTALANYVIASAIYEWQSHKAVQPPA